MNFSGVSTGEILTWWQSVALCSLTPDGLERSAKGVPPN
jgi:hypothetical protein